MADPYWTDEHGRRLAPQPCPRCGANVGPMPLRVELLRHLGWEPYTVQTYQSWCGHTQEIIPFPLGGRAGDIRAGARGGAVTGWAKTRVEKKAKG